MTTPVTDSPRRRINIPYKPRKWARPKHDSLCRWMGLVLHRRAGKTVATINHLQRAATNDAWERRRLRALEPSLSDRHVTDLLRDRFYGHVLPTYRQAEVTVWAMLKYYGERVPGVVFNEQKLRVTYPNGSRLQLFGSDYPDALRGIGFSGIAFDEYGQHPPNVFSEVISKALADHLGFAIFLGTIKGKNQLYRTYQAGKDDPAWFTVWQDVDGSLETETDATTTLLRQAVTDDHALIAKGLMTQEEFDQEWYLSSDAAIKGAYYTTLLTAARKDGRITRVPYDPALPVDTDWDLGISDKMTIWFSQSLRSGEVRLIDYYENSGEGIPHYAGVLKEKGYVVKTEVRCPPITEVRCPLFTGYRVQSSRMMRVWECGHLARREMSKVRRTGISTRRRSVMLMPPRSPRPLSCVGRASRPFSFPVAGSSRL